MRVSHKRLIFCFRAIQYFRTEVPLGWRRHIEIGIKAWPIQPRPGRADFLLSHIGCPLILHSLLGLLEIVFLLSLHRVGVVGVSRAAVRLRVNGRR